MVALVQGWEWGSHTAWQQPDRIPRGAGRSSRQRARALVARPATVATLTELHDDAPRGGLQRIVQAATRHDGGCYPCIAA